MNKFKNFINYLNDSKGSSHGRAAIYYFICHMLVSGLSFISTPVFSRLMDKPSYGAFSNFAAWESVLIPIITLNLRATIARSKYDYGEKNDTFISSILAISNLATLFGFIVIEFNSAYFIKVFDMEMTYIRILFFYMLLSPAFLFQQIQYRMYNKYRLFVFYSVCSTILRMGLSVFLVSILEDKFAGRICGYVLPAIMIYGIIYADIWRRGKRVDFGCCVYALKMSIPLIPSALSATLLTSSDQILITKFSGSTQTALYAIMYSVSSIAAVAWTAMNQAWGPWFYDNLNEENHEKIRKNANIFQFGYLALIFLVMLIAPEIVLIMGGTSYYETIWGMPPVILAMICQFYYAFYFNIEYFYGKTFVISFGTMLAAICNIGLNYIFIPQYGYVAAAYTTLVGYLIMLVYHYLIVRFLLKKDKIYDTRVFVVSLIGITIVQVIVAFLYNYNWIRYGILLIYIMIVMVVAWKNREKIFFVIGLKRGRKVS